MNEIVNTIIKLKRGKTRNILKRRQSKNTLHVSFASSSEQHLAKKVYRIYKHLYSTLFGLFSLKFFHQQ